MDKFKNHRRNIIKKFSIRGVEKSASKEEGEISIHTSGVIRELNVEGKTSQSDWVSVDFPANIEAMNGNGVNITVSGINKFNQNDLVFEYKNPDTVTGIVEYGKNYFSLDDSSPNNISSRYFSSENKIEFKPNTKYTSKCTVTLIDKGSPNLNHTGSMTCSLLCQDSQTWSSINKIYLVNGYAVNDGAKVGTYDVYTTFTTPNDLSKIKYITVRVAEKSKVIFENLMVVEGEYTKANFPDFEEYIQPKTVFIDTELHGIEGNNDILSLNYAKDCVEINRMVKVLNLEDLINDNAILDRNESGNAVRLSIKERWKEGTRALCSHCKHYTDVNFDLGTELCFEIVQNLNETVIYFYWILQDSIEEFKNWARENQVKVAFVMDESEIETVDFDLPEDILTYNATSIISATGSNGISAIYYDLEK